MKASHVVDLLNKVEGLRGERVPARDERGPMALWC
jgi:hypothetical protein